MLCCLRLETITAIELIVNVNDPARMGMEDHHAIVDDRIMVFAHAVALGHRIGIVGSRSRITLRMVAAISFVATSEESGRIRTTSDVLVVGCCEMG